MWDLPELAKLLFLEAYCLASSDATLIDLDNEENSAVKKLQARGCNPGGWEGRWSRCRFRLDSLERKYQASSRLFFVDVGAGCLQTQAAFQYFSVRSRTTILVTAPFETILQRHKGRGTEELRRTEFSDCHMSLYEKLSSVDTSLLSPEEAVERVVFHIEGLVAKHST